VRPPLLTATVAAAMQSARQSGRRSLVCSLDLQRSETTIEIDVTCWRAHGIEYPYLETCRDRTICYWDGAAFASVSRYSSALIKLVPTEWGPPTFEIDGIKMLPTAKVSPYADAGRKVHLIRPGGKRILDTCGGLGYFAAWCLAGGAASVQSFEKHSDVLWLRSLNPWSPAPDERHVLSHADITQQIGELPHASFDAILHDPPRFGIAGELYSKSFYAQLAAVLKPGGSMFHYTGAPNRLTSGRDVSNEVAQRLGAVGFRTRVEGDGILAVLAARNATR